MTKELIERLRNTPNWQRESYGDWKQGTVHYDRAPFEAADTIESLQAENESLKSQLDDYTKMMTAKCDALAAKLATMEADAGRYRDIREGLVVDDNSGIVISLVDDFGGETLRGEQADAAIDAAKGVQQ